MIMTEAHLEQREKIVSLLLQAEKLAADLREDVLTYLIERATDEARASMVPHLSV